MTAPRILVVDDYAPNRYVLRRILARGRYDVVEASDRETARAAAGGGIALAILDVSLPDTTGFELCSDLRARHPAMPIILVSACYTASASESEWRSAGAIAFLEQPVDAAELLALVARSLGASAES